MAKKDKLSSKSGKMTGTREEPVEVGDEAGGEILIRQESSMDEEKPHIHDVPLAEDVSDDIESRDRRHGGEEGLFVSEESEDEGFQTQRSLPSKRRKAPQEDEEDRPVDDDDKKKMAMNTTYNGFSIYGRILCLVVKRKGISRGKQVVGGSGQAMMEEWITSTQMGQQQMMDD